MTSSTLRTLVTVASILAPSTAATPPPAKVPCIGYGLGFVASIWLWCEVLPASLRELGDAEPKVKYIQTF